MSSELICLLGADDFAFGPDCYVSAALLLELHIILLLLCVCWDRARCTISLQEVSESEVSVFCLLLLRGCFKLLVLRECYSPRAGYHCYSWTATRHLVEGLHTSSPLSFWNLLSSALFKAIFKRKIWRSCKHINQAKTLLFCLLLLIHNWSGELLLLFQRRQHVRSHSYSKLQGIAL